jgi:hypothetical protein
LQQHSLFIIIKRPQVGGPSVPPKLGLHRIILQLQDSSLLPRSSLAAPTGRFIITHSSGSICWASAPQRRQRASCAAGFGRCIPTSCDEPILSPPATQP